MKLSDLQLEEILAHINSNTTSSNELLLNGMAPAQLSAGWTDDDRKKIHEHYWHSTIEEKIAHLLSAEAEDFDSFWQELNYHELLNGSGLGHKLKKKHSRLNYIRNFFGLKPFDEKMAWRDQSIKFMYEGHVDFVSALVLNCLKRELVLGALRKFITSDSIIVDLGSGWGRYSTLFANRIPNIKVFAGELSSSGQSATQTISQKFNLKINSFYFNYHDWHELINVCKDNRKRHIIFFSNHSIEQVTYLQPTLFAEILDNVTQASFVHLEPVGWQVPNQTIGMSKFSDAPKRNLGKFAGYNKNLIVQLKLLENQERIDNVNVFPNHIAFGRLKNSGTLIHYVARR